MIQLSAYDSLTLVFAPLLCLSTALALVGASNKTRKLLIFLLTKIGKALATSDEVEFVQIYTTVITVVLPLWILSMYVIGIAMLTIY